jgi:predicted ATPase/DNA-binding winged helix-turn-helix (wHTH) protein
VGLTDNGDELRFGPFRLSRRKRALDADTGPVALGGRAFDILAILLDRPNRLVTKNELLDLVWPGISVEENNLHVQMAALRRALGAHQTLIQTIPGRGYRFAGELVLPAAGAAGELAEPTAPSPVEPTIPAELAPLIGRDAELAELRALLQKHRLVTVTGPGGIGKTRLTIALGHAVLGDFTGGARLIDLAPLADDSLVEGAAVTALGLRLSESAVPVESIAAALKDRRTLLLFDNCEHVLAGTAALVETLLKRCPAIAVVATSQEPLRIEAEAIYRLDPLALPPREARDTREVAQFGAVALFVRRVEAADRRFQLGTENTVAVAEICRSLDGIPLALEMAAARVPALGVEGLRSRLGERLRLLNLGARTAEARHRTLRDTVAWSCDLLDEADRAVFRRLGVFAGGFSAESATAILTAEGEDEWAIADALSRLIDKSLVVTESGEPPRYRQLETLRLFATEQLAALGEHDDFTRRHAAYFDRFFEAAYDDWEEADDSAWLARIAPELDNMRAALDWALATPGQRDLAISLAGSAALLWDKLSLLAEGRRYLERAEALITPETPPDLAARLHRQIGNLWHTSDRPRALASLERAAGLYRDLGDRLNLGAVLALIGLVRGFLGAPAEASAALTEARGILANSGRRKSLLNVMNNLGVIAAMDGDMATARDLFEEALQITRRAGARDGEILVLINLAEIEFNLGEIDAAVERTGAAVAYLRTTGQQADLGWALVNLGTYLLIAGRLAEAETAAREALRLVRPVGGFILRVCLQQWALLAASAGRLKDAARLAGFVDAGYEKAGETREPSEQRVYDDLQARLTAGLTPIQLAHLAAEGAAWTEKTAASHAEPL